MGWQESPAYFCTTTETGRDLINWMIEEDFQLPPHPFEQFVLPNQRLCKQPTTSPNLLMRPWKAAIYVDDFILAVLSCFGLKFIRQVARATLFGIHAIFPPPSLSGHTSGKDPIPKKKLKRGDARLST